MCTGMCVCVQVCGFMSVFTGVYIYIFDVQFVCLCVRCIVSLHLKCCVLKWLDSTSVR